METVELNVQNREPKGSNGAKKLRKAGNVPAVVYGHGEPTVALAVSEEELVRAIRHGARVVDLKRDGNVDKALIRDLQWDPFGQQILHVDFTRVKADERVQLEVRVEIRGSAPGVAAGGVLIQPIHSLMIECPVIAVPDSIRVPVTELQLEGVIHIRDLKLPEGITAIGEEDAIVVQVVPKELLEEQEEEGAGEKAEPELIRKEKGEDEEED